METPPQSHACVRSTGFVWLLKSLRVFSLLKLWLCLSVSSHSVPGSLISAELMAGEGSLCRCQGSISVATAAMEALASHLAPQAIRVPCTLSSVLLEGKLGSAFFHTSWGADNSQSADLGSAPPEISALLFENVSVEKIQLWCSEKSPSRDMDRGIFPGNFSAGSWGIVFRGGSCRDGIVSVKFRFQKGKAQSLRWQQGAKL